MDSIQIPWMTCFPICGIVVIGESLRLLTTAKISKDINRVQIKIHNGQEPVDYGVTVEDFAQGVTAIHFDRQNVLVQVWYHKLSNKREIANLFGYNATFIAGVNDAVSKTN